MNPKSNVPPAGRSRREFVKAFAQLGAYFGLCAPVCKYFIGEVQAQTANLTGLFNVDLAVSPFNLLQQLNGSVRVEVPNGSAITALTALSGNANPSVIITRVATSGTSQFGALGQRCTHQGFAVNAKIAASPNLICSSQHGGSYNPATGAVTSAPAPSALTAYLAVFTAAPTPGTLQIRIAGIGYSIVGNAVSTTNGPRVRLQFPTRTLSNYDVRFRSTVGGTNSGTPLLFSTTQNGALTSTNVAGNGAVQSVFLSPPPQVGFYIISAKP